MRAKGLKTRRFKIQLEMPPSTVLQSGLTSLRSSLSPPSSSLPFPVSPPADSATPTFRRRRRNPSGVQPRQVRVSTLEEEADLSTLSTLQGEAKPTRTNARYSVLSKSINYAETDSTRGRKGPVTTRRNPPRRKSRKYQSIDFESHRRRSRKHKETTGRSGSTGDALPNIPSNFAQQLSHLQRYFLQFHQKSRFLLSQLERDVLGTKRLVERT